MLIYSPQGYFNRFLERDIMLSLIVPRTQAAFAICFAREILCFKKLPALGSSVHMLRFLQSLLEKNTVRHPEYQKVAVEKDTHHLLDLYTCLFLLFRLSGSRTRVINRPGI